ncbi:RHS repeat domain-containing protein [Stanieria cyanosphaera]|uniref:RHS repeat protein n=1 Tax=Stanieria cyanosphaera TaxID=102116 RepID=UPI0002D3818D|nr:RHS repeat protein [Stanieria cyanosphaera]
MNRTTTYTYDALNRQVSVKDPLNHVTTTNYDSVGNVTTITDPLNNTTTYSYDALNRVNAVTNAEGNTVTTEYDGMGNVVGVTDELGRTTEFGYNERNEQTSVTNALGYTTKSEYDSAGNLISVTDARGNTTSYEYDKLNRLISEIDANNQDVNYQYDGASQLKSAFDPDSAYSYQYDLAGRLTQVDNVSTTNVPNVVFNYTYDPVDNLTQVTDSIDGVERGIETFAYDELDRVTSITQSGNGVEDKRVDYTYDAASQMTQVSRYKDLAGTQPVAESNYKFDEAGSLTELTHNSDGETISAYEWAYDQANRITQATSPDGTSDYNYDKTDQLTDAEHSYQEDESYTYDENGNRKGYGYVTGENNQLLSDGKYNYEYDSEGNRTKRTSIATGEVTNYSWDYRNRLTGVVTKDSGGNVIKQADYTYDVFDRRIGKSVDSNGDGVAEKVEKFVYDGDHIALVFDGEGNQIERFFHGTGVDSVIAQENASGKVLWALTDNQGSVRAIRS